MKPGVTASFGLRYDWQNYFHDVNNLAPRVSLAYAPGNATSTVFRAGAGLFNDRSGPAPIADLLHAQPGGLVKYVITDPSYPDPAQGAAATAEAPSVVQLAPDVQIPQILQFSVGVDQQVRKATTLSFTYTSSHGFHIVPIDRCQRAAPAGVPVPAGSRVQRAVRQIGSDRRQRATRSR